MTGKQSFRLFDHFEDDPRCRCRIVLEPRMVDELAAVGLAHAFLDGGDLPLVEFHELPDRLRGQG